MKKAILFLCLFLLSIDMSAQYVMDDTSEISLLVGGASEEEMFTVYGHAAIRVHDPQQKLDYLFNYGLFDFSKPNFVYRFAKGETDYHLGIGRFQDYVVECKMRGCSLTELVLDLSHREKNKILQALIDNAKPENRVYRYNFFFDNCATRPVVVLKDQVDGSILFPPSTDTCAFRDMINHATRNKPWLTLGCDLALGSMTDRLATAEEMIFLPSYMQEALVNAKLKDYDGKVRPLVKETKILVKENLPPVKNTWLTPLFSAWMLFLFVFALTLWGIKLGRTFVGLDYFLFTLAGVSGCLLSYISLLSEHPFVFPNWNLLFLHPFHLLAVVLFAVKGCKPFVTFYHFTNFVALILLLAVWIVGEQHMNAAFVPLVLTLLTRSLYNLYRTLKKNK